MRKLRHIRPALAAGAIAAGALAGGVTIAPSASAQPAQCENAGPNTVRCSSEGHTRIYTSPPDVDVADGYGGFPYWAWD